MKCTDCAVPLVPIEGTHWHECPECSERYCGVCALPCSQCSCPECEGCEKTVPAVIHYGETKSFLCPACFDAWWAWFEVNAHAEGLCDGPGRCGDC